MGNPFSRPTGKCSAKNVGIPAGLLLSACIIPIARCGSSLPKMGTVTTAKYLVLGMVPVLAASYMYAHNNDEPWSSSSVEEKAILADLSGGALVISSVAVGRLCSGS